MKKVLFSLALLLTSVGAWAQETQEPFGLPTVSDENNTVWYNIYFSSYGQRAGEFYPVYLFARSGDTEDVNLNTEKLHYGLSTFNTKEQSDNISWAIYKTGDYYYLKRVCQNRHIQYCPK